MNKNFNSKEERYSTIRQLCKMDLKHRRKLSKIYNFIDANKEVFSNIDACSVFEVFSIDEISDLILDLFHIPEDDDYFCREGFNDIWSAYINDESEEIDDDVIIESFIQVMEQEIFELDIRYLNKGKKLEEKE